MLIKLGARHGRDYFTGQVGFTCWPDAHLISGGIALETDKESWGKGLAVATHALIVSGPDTIIETNPGGVKESPIRKLLEQREVLFWTKTLKGSTDASVAETLRIAREMVQKNIPYDYWAVLLGFPTSDQDGADGKSNRFNDPDKFFCSELVFHIIKRINPLLRAPLPAEVLAWPEGFVHPDRLDDFPIWEPEALAPAA